MRREIHSDPDALERRDAVQALGAVVPEHLNAWSRLMIWIHLQIHSVCVGASEVVVALY